MSKKNDERTPKEMQKLIEEIIASIKDEYTEVVNYVENDLLKKLEILNSPEWITNPYSGKKCLLDPVQVALYDYIIGAEIMLNMCYSQELSKKYSRAKLYFRNKWANEYMTLLD